MKHNSLERLYELYDLEGFKGLYRGSRDFVMYNIFGFKNPYYRRREDNELRWELIKDHLEGKEGTLLDVGCAEGYLTARAAEYGLNATGIEVDRDRFNYAENKWGANERVSFVNKQLTPDTIEDILPVDITLFLTVHHHWVSEFGYENSISMFKELLRKSDICFYEPPGNRPLPSTEKILDPSDSIEHYTNLLNKEFNDIKICSVTMVPYGRKHRSDPIFVLDSRQYE